MCAGRGRLAVSWVARVILDSTRAHGDSLRDFAELMLSAIGRCGKVAFT